MIYLNEYYWIGIKKNDMYSHAQLAGIEMNIGLKKRKINERINSTNTGDEYDCKKNTK